MTLRKNLGTSYTPTYFLASLGNGGLTISFFLYLMFLVPHPNTPIPTFDAIAAFFAQTGMLNRVGIILAVAAMVGFAFRHFRLLFWNLREYMAYRRTTAYERLLAGNSAISLMALPLTLGMSINVAFALGAVLTPGLWAVVEYLFPFALAAFAAVGTLALRTFIAIFAQRLATGSFDCSRNNNLSQMIAIFAFAMVGVGFAASAAMSTVKVTATIGMLGAIFFTAAAILLGMAQFVLAMRAMLEHGIEVEMSVSLWIIIPILTLIGITFLRLLHGLHHHFEFHSSPALFFLLTSSIIAVQLLFGGLGFAVMQRMDYFRTYIRGAARNPGSYALICPGVALFVMGMFFVHSGLVQNGIVAKYSLVHFLLLLPLVYLQARTIMTLWRLDRKLIAPETPPTTSGQTPVGAA